MDGDRYVIVRFRPPDLMPLTQVEVPGWEVLSSLMFDSLDAARQFAGLLDHARVYRLQAVES